MQEKSVQTLVGTWVQMKRDTAVPELPSEPGPRAVQHLQVQELLEAEALGQPRGPVAKGAGLHVAEHGVNSSPGVLNNMPDTCVCASPNPGWRKGGDGVWPHPAAPGHTPLRCFSLCLRPFVCAL